MGKEFLSNIWLRIAIAAILLCLYVPYYLAVRGIQPPVGVYIAVLGGLAAGVTLRREPSVREKACWIIAITILMLAEVRNLYVEADRQHQGAKKVSDALDLTNQGLKKTLDGLSVVVGQLGGISGGITDATTKSTTQFNTTTSKLTEAINMETGGNGFCYLLPTGVMNETEVQAVVILVGHYPLYNVGMRVVDAKFIKMSKSVLQSDILSTQIGDLSPPGSAYEFGTTLKFKVPGDYQELNIFFSGKNGRWTQLWRLQKVNGQWESAILVTGNLDQRHYPKGAILKRWVTKGFPAQRIADDKDWQQVLKARMPEAAYPD